MLIYDYVSLLPHHQNAFYAPPDYERQPFLKNSLKYFARHAVRRLLINFVKRGHYFSWHYADFLFAQYVLSKDFNISEKLSYFTLSSLDYFAKHSPGCLFC